MLLCGRVVDVQSSGFGIFTSSMFSFRHWPVYTAEIYFIRFPVYTSVDRLKYPYPSRGRVCITSIYFYGAVFSMLSTRHVFYTKPNKMTPTTVSSAIKPASPAIVTRAESDPVQRRYPNVTLRDPALPEEYSQKTSPTDIAQHPNRGYPTITPSTPTHPIPTPTPPPS